MIRSPHEQQNKHLTPVLSLLPPSMRNLLITKLSYYAAAQILVTFTLAVPCRGQSLVGKSMQVSRLIERSPGDVRGVDSEPFIVGPGVEVMHFGTIQSVTPPLPGYFDIDVSDSRIEITATMNQPMLLGDSLQFFKSDADGRPQIYMATINRATTWFPLNEPGRVSGFGAWVFVNFTGLSGLAAQNVVIDLTLLDVPEPSGAALGGLAVAGLGALRRRRARVPLGRQVHTNPRCLTT